MRLYFTRVRRCRNTRAFLFGFGSNSLRMFIYKYRYISQGIFIYLCTVYIIYVQHVCIFLAGKITLNCTVIEWRHPPLLSQTFDILCNYRKPEKYCNWRPWTRTTWYTNYLLSWFIFWKARVIPLHAYVHFRIFTWASWTRILFVLHVCPFRLHLLCSLFLPRLLNGRWILEQCCFVDSPGRKPL
jgi:hypothetical protein